MGVETNSREAGARCYAFGWVLLALMSCFAAVGASADPVPFVVSEQTRKAPMASEVWYLVEGASPMTIGQAVNADQSGQFVHGAWPAISLGFQEHAHWFRLDLTTNHAMPLSAVLSIQYPILDEVDVYLANADGYVHFALGDQRPMATRPLQIFEHAANLVLHPGQTQRVYVRVKTESTMTVPMFVSSQNGYVEGVYKERWLLGIFYGVMLGVIAYALISFLITRQFLLLPYIIHVSCIVAIEAALDGLIFSKLQQALNLLECVATLTAVIFAGRYMQSDENSFFRVANRLVVLYLAVIAGTDLLLNPVTAAKLSLGSVVLVVVYVLVQAVWRRWVDGYRPAQYFLIAFLPMLILVTINILVISGAVPPTSVPPFLYRFGFLIQVLLFAVIQGQRMTMLQEESIALRAQSIETEAEYKARSEFMAKISHEIRTPLNGIMGMVELLRDSKLSTNQNQFLEVIRNSGTALLLTINDVLDFSKIEAGKMEIEQVEFDFEEIIDDSMSIFLLQAENKTLWLLLEMEPDLPCTLLGDPLRIRQILVNLIGNALKFTQDGGIRIVISADPGEPDGRQWVRFEVIDTGIGIPEDVQNKLFESFSQADTSTTRKFGGTGLGLSISKQLAELMGGQIGVTSVPGEGANFWFRLPFEGREAKPASRISHEQALTRLRVLIVDPQESYGEIMQREISAMGGRCEYVLSGHAAIGHLTRTGGDGQGPCAIVIFEDVSDMSGLELAEQIRERELAAGADLFLTTRLRTRIEERALKRARVARALPRPFSRYQLCGLLAEAAGCEASAESEDDRDQEMMERGLLQGLRVLVAEDNQVNVMVIKGYLKKLGIEPEIAENGVEAVACLERSRKPYDLILMDCLMPEMDGFEATRAIRKFEDAKGLRRTTIIASTAHTAPEEYEKVFNAGMDDIVPKPVDMANLREKLLYWASKLRS